MARIVTTVKRKRRLRFEGLAIMMFTAAIVSTIFSNLFLRNTNASLMIEIQNLNKACETLKGENQNLTIQIQTLQNKERIFTIAESAGLSRNNENIIGLSGE